MDITDADKPKKTRTEYNKEFYTKNPDYFKTYRKNNNDRLKEYYKSYLEQHNPLDKIKCDICNIDVCKSSISRHRKSKKHIKLENTETMEFLSQ
jgi:hypothetical protein